jgi:hypothetical protein
MTGNALVLWSDRLKVMIVRTVAECVCKDNPTWRGLKPSYLSDDPIEAVSGISYGISNRLKFFAMCSIAAWYPNMPSPHITASALSLK